MNIINKLLLRYFDYIYRSMRNSRRLTQERMMEKDSQAKVLDCGCREGNNTIRLSGLINATQVFGLDYNRRVLQEASHRGIRSVQADLNQNLPLKKASVDVIIASDILEHLVLPDLFLKELYRVLRPGGYLILDTPNLASWHNIFALLLGIQPFSGPNITNMAETDSPLITNLHRKNLGFTEGMKGVKEGEPDLARHIVVTAYFSLLKLFRKAGFQFEEVRGFGYYPFPPLLAKLFQWFDIRHTHHILIKARKPKI
jgi:SAM-dependent methyltransferase